jgi:ubiquinone biosynthesis protein
MIDPEKSSLRRVAPRLLQILRVLARHKFLGALRGQKHWPPPKEVRETSEELGLTFIKFGLLLAMRRDLLPDAYTEELARLHDRLPALGMDAVRATIEAELGAPLVESFSAFSEKPLAAATIAQVHEATTHDGRHVAVKVQRPGLQAIISTDMTDSRSGDIPRPAPVTVGFINNLASAPWWLPAFDSLQNFSVLPRPGSQFEKK